MKAHAIALVCVLFASVLSAALSRDAAASSENIIQRCEAADGSAVYTDKPCKLFEARPTRISEDLSLRLALADAESDEFDTLGTYRDASEPLQVAIPGRRAPSDGCARSPQQLSRDLLGAFALHDVNRIAESYHWVGMSHRQAMPVMKQLERLSAAPLADARFLAAWIGPADAGTHAIPADAGLMQLVFAGGGERIVDFEVRRYAGCYFITA